MLVGLCSRVFVYGSVVANGNGGIVTDVVCGHVMLFEKEICSMMFSRLIEDRDVDYEELVVKSFS